MFERVGTKTKEYIPKISDEISENFEVVFNCSFIVLF